MAKEITVIMNRTYTTSFTVKAESNEEAIEKVKAMGDDKYVVELEQCCVTDETLEIEE